MDRFTVLSLHLPGQTEEEHETIQSLYPISGLRFKPGTFRIGNRSVNLLNGMFGMLAHIRQLNKS
jgi:hypothetical protein